jgi:predicted permease
VGRRLLRAPGFALLAAITVGVGVGVNAAAFAAFDAAVLRPLPFERPEELVAVALDLSARGGAEREELTAADVLDLRAEPGVFSGLAGWTMAETVLRGAGPAEVVGVATVTAGMFTRVLREQPSLGRSFVPEEHRPGAPGAVILSHALWTLRLDGDPSVLGKVITFGGEPHVIVGVMPRGFEPPFAEGAVAWTAARTRVERCRGCPTMAALGRLASGTSAAVALERGNAVLLRLAEAYPDTDAGARLLLTPLSGERTRLREAFRPILLAAGVVLLLTCANLAVLLVTQGGDRRDELRLRSAVGGERRHLVGHLVTEAALLTAAGTVVGVFLAGWVTDAILPLVPREGASGVIRDLSTAGLGMGAVGGFVIVVAVTLVPSLMVTRGVAGLPSRRATGTCGGGRWTQALLVAQVGLATTLAAGAVLGVRAVRDLRSVDRGFDPRGVLAIELAPGGAPQGGAVVEDWLTAFLARVAEMPGVASVGAVTGSPLEPPPASALVRVGHQAGEATARRSAALRRVEGAYFYTLGRKVVQGRALRPGDGTTTPAPVVVNEAFANAYLGYPRRSALEARVAITGDGSAWRSVAGVVADARPPGASASPTVFLPGPVLPSASLTVFVRGAGDPGIVAASARGILAAVAPDAAVRSVAPLPALVDGAFAPERFAAALLAAFAAVTLALSAVGLYAVLSQRARRRRTETGIRLALGASPDDVRSAVAAPGLRLTLLGVAIGGAMSAWLTGLLGVVFSLPARLDPVALGAAAALLLGVSWVAALGPTRGAARLDPASALRDE